jgi:hypothetical protein
VTPRAGLGLVAALLAVMLVAGCYATPPLRISAGGGGGVGTIVALEGDTRHDNSLAGFGELRLGVAPLSYRPARRLDVSLGWALDSALGIDAGDSMRHGPYVEADWFLRRSAPGAEQAWRLGPTLGLESTISTDDRNAGDISYGPDVGFGASVGVLLEAVEAVRGPFSLGKAIGELGLGIGARVGVRYEEKSTYGYGIVSVEFRLPGAYGSVF